MPLSGIVLVTGGAGFIGSHIATALAEQGATVRVIDDLSTGYRHNLEAIASRVDFIEASLRDDQALRRALSDVEIVFHEAAIPSVPRSIEHPIETHEASVQIAIVAAQPRFRELQTWFAAAPARESGDFRHRFPRH